MARSLHGQMGVRPGTGEASGEWGVGRGQRPQCVDLQLLPVQAGSATTPSREEKAGRGRENPLQPQSQHGETPE